MAQKKNTGTKSSSKSTKSSSKKSSKSTTNQVKREVKKAAKKHPGVVIAVIAIILVIAIVAGLVYYFFVYKKKDAEPGENPSGGGHDHTDVAAGTLADITSADLSIHFLELGVKYVGDCTLIKVGNTEVLIDAGAKSRAPGIKTEELAPTQAMLDYVATYCTDGKLEYVVATHAHQDHIAGLVGDESANARKGFLYQYEIGTVIQFSGHKTDSSIYKRYAAAIDTLKEGGTTVLGANECVGQTFYLDEAHTISLSVLYQKYYEQSTSNENDYSVCTLLTQKIGEKENHYLFTGDLEEAGEKSLVENNPNLPHCVLFKGGHHGSSTASNDVLLNKITPENIAICTCAGTYEYANKPTAEKPDNYLNTFPTQEALDRMAKHTQNIYVTTLGVLNDAYETTGFTSMNGNIVFYYGKGEEEEEKSLKLWCSNNTTVLKDTEWFKANRSWNGVE